MNYRLKTIEEMDACVFSSDMLYNDEERKHFEAMVARWATALNETQNVALPRRDEAPAKAVEWQGLTDEERDEICLGDEAIARDIEAKLREKNT